MSFSSNNMDGKTALVTGAGRGIGRAIALGLARSGTRLALVARSRGALGDVDVLINNAAVVTPLGASASVDPAQWAAAIGVNVVAVANLSFLRSPPGN